MKIKNKCSTIFLACVVAIFIASSGSSAGTKDRPTISDAEYAKAWVQIQNTMSKHAYYHAVNDHKTEVNDIWVKRDGPYFKTASWSSPRAQTDVGEQFYEAYVTKYTGS